MLIDETIQAESDWQKGIMSDIQISDHKISNLINRCRYPSHVAYLSIIHCISELSWSFISLYFSSDEKPEKDRHPSCQACSFLLSLGSLVAIYNTAWNWDIIIVYCLIFRLHYTLLQRFRNHAEPERKPFHWINIYDCIICQHLQSPLHKLL